MYRQKGHRTFGMIGRLCAVLLCFGSQCVSIAEATPLEFLLGGSRINYLGHEYKARENKTYFQYRISRGLLTRPLQNFQLVLPNEATRQSLVRVDTPVNFLIAPQDAEGKSAISFSNLTPLNTTIDLVLLGNVGEGPLKVQAKAASAPLLTQLLPGPIAGNLNIDLGDLIPPLVPTPSGTPSTPANPACLLDAALPLNVAVGESLQLGVKVTAPNNDEVTIQYDNWPSSARMSATSGSSVDSGDIVTVDLAPTSLDVGFGKILPIRLLSSTGTTDCDIEINVRNNRAPQPAVVPLADPIACQGTLTQVQLDGSPSTDPDGDALTFSWQHNCQSTILQNANSAQARLAFSLPGTGVAQDCAATLTVRDGKTSAVLEVPIHVAACRQDCLPSEKDSCGVCNGQNSCVDCEGVAFGGKQIDRCGVCGGSNACVDCAGAVNGASATDECGICNGDGSACQTCNSVNLQSVLLRLDGAAAAQARVITANVRALKNRVSKKQIRNYVAQATKLYTHNWTTVWSLNQTNSLCSSYVNCSEVSSSSNLGIYSSNSRALHKLALKVANVIKKKGGKNRSKTAAKVRKAAKNALAMSDVLAKLYPQSTHSCQ